MVRRGPTLPGRDWVATAPLKGDREHVSHGEVDLPLKGSIESSISIEHVSVLWHIVQRRFSRKR